MRWESDDWATCNSNYLLFGFPRKNCALLLCTCSRFCVPTLVCWPKCNVAARPTLSTKSEARGCHTVTRVMQTSHINVGKQREAHARPPSLATYSALFLFLKVSAPPEDTRVSCLSTVLSCTFSPYCNLGGRRRQLAFSWFYRQPSPSPPAFFHRATTGPSSSPSQS